MSRRSLTVPGPPGTIDALDPTRPHPGRGPVRQLVARRCLRYLRTEQGGL